MILSVFFILWFCGDLIVDEHLWLARTTSVKELLGHRKTFITIKKTISEN